MIKEIADLRREYSQQVLLEENVAVNPIHQFRTWWMQAIESEIVEPNAMTLATASADGLPSARIVLMKGFDENGFIFFGNYKSFKGRQLEENPRACLVFFWKELERQVRITGVVDKLTESESDEYFTSRPVASRIGAWTSPQSEIIESRSWIDERYKMLSEKMRDGNIQRPPHWGGYLVKPVTIEFWQGRPSRLHDRIRYNVQENGNWKIERLAP